MCYYYDVNIFMNQINIPFDTKWRNVSVAVSGGADSAMLLYLICCKINGNTKIHVINNIRCWKTKPWQQYDFSRVIDWFRKRFPEIKFKIHTNFVPPELEWGNIGPTITDEYGKLVSGDTLELRSFAEYVCHTNKVDAYFNGVTRNPRDVDFNGMPTRDIDPTEDNKHLEEMVHMGKLAYHPFRFIEKSVILKEYRTLGIMDLFRLTRSCEGTFPGLDYKTYVPGNYVPLCGDCFWCKEREWAVEQTK